MHFVASSSSPIASWLMCGLPYQLFRSLPEAVTTPTRPQTSYLLFLLPRLCLFLWSLFADGCIFYAASVWRPSASSTSGSWRILSAHSWTFAALVMMTRTFSNTIETNVLAAAIALAAWASATSRLGDKGNQPRGRSELPLAAILFGLLVGVGASVRLSLLFFAWPIGVWLIFLHVDSQPSRTHRGVAQWIRSAAIVGLAVGVSAALVAVLLAVVDSIFYETLQICVAGLCTHAPKEHQAAAWSWKVRSRTHFSHVGGAIVYSCLLTYFLPSVCLSFGVVRASSTPRACTTICTTPTQPTSAITACTRATYI